MGFKQAEFKMATDFSAAELREKIAKKLHLKEFSYTLQRQSLDARNKHHIYWHIQVGVSSAALAGPDIPPHPTLHIPFKKRGKKVIVVGSGPAGFFTAYILQKAGFSVTLIEQGGEVNTRFKDIIEFERTGLLDERNNYAFGEGGAGTFSDGKLTSRTKSISLERDFIFDTYINAGAPPEIAWLASPHLGTDNLRKIVKNLRYNFLHDCGTILFNTRVEDVSLEKHKTSQYVKAIHTEHGLYEADYFIFAIGHSSYSTYRMLINHGFPFQVKAFALGCRVEHLQQWINRTQWHNTSLPGIKAAEYRLTYKPGKTEHNLPVYSFCMCPGGKVVPASVSKGTLVVNGMSNYRRDASFGNAAMVVGLHLNNLLKRQLHPLEALDWLHTLEEKCYATTHNYQAPACKVSDFIEGKTSPSVNDTSYPFGLQPYDLAELFPKTITDSLKMGLKDFCRKMKGFEEGTLMGLESKTSSPIQVLRDEKGKPMGFENVYMVGEGSGFSGGIISSAADGIKTALAIIGETS